MRADSCIFLETPGSCSFAVENKCIADPAHIITMCVINRRKYRVDKSKEEWILRMFVDNFVRNKERVR